MNCATAACEGGGTLGAKAGGGTLYVTGGAVADAADVVGIAPG